MTHDDNDSQPENKQERVSPITGFAPPVAARFKPGQTGNPGGLPKAVREVRKLAAQKCPRAIERLGEWMESDEYKASIMACLALLNRGCGKDADFRQLYPLKQLTEPSAANGLTDEQSKRIYEILKEGKNG